MSNPTLMLVAGGALALAACASPARDDASTDADTFASDRITVVTRGEGTDDILLIPGLASHRDVWAGVADSLDERYHLHLVQVKGFAGLEPGANADGQVSAPVAEEIARYIREADLERPAVIGHSMGGTIAMMLAARHQETVGRLMVVDMLPFLGAVFGPPNATPEQLRQAADTFRAQVLADTAGAPNGVLEQMFPGMTRVESLRPVLLEGLRGTDRRTAANAFHELIMADLRPELSRITVPVTVLYVVPPNVQMTPEQFDAAMQASFASVPHVRLRRVAESAHFIMFDQPAHFLAEVDTLMQAPPPARP